MALEDPMASRFSNSSASVSNHVDKYSARDESEAASTSANATMATSMAYLPQTVVFCELRHDGFEACVPSGPSDSGLVSKWRPKDRSCQVDLVKENGGHIYFIRFLDSMDAFPEQRALAAFVLAVIVDGHRRGQEACIQANLIHVCLRLLQIASPHDPLPKPLLLLSLS